MEKIIIAGAEIATLDIQIASTFTYGQIERAIELSHDAHPNARYTLIGGRLQEMFRPVLDAVKVPSSDDLDADETPAQIASSLFLSMYLKVNWANVARAALDRLEGHNEAVEAHKNHVWTGEVVSGH